MTELEIIDKLALVEDILQKQGVDPGPMRADAVYLLGNYTVGTPEEIARHLSKRTRQSEDVEQPATPESMRAREVELKEAGII